VEKVWLKSYAENVPAEIPVPEIKSLREMAEYSFREFPDRPAFTNFRSTLTYRDIDRLSMKFACYLQKSLGLTRGERVAIMLPNVLQYPVVLIGLFRAGLVAVNVNPLYTPRELKHQLSDSGAKCIIILENFAHTLEEVLADIKIEHIVTTRIGDLLGWPKSVITNFVVKHIKKAVPPFSLPGRVRLPSALRAGGKYELPSRRRQIRA
jgi:long-chain acyl-CoA synthetase